MPKANTAKDSAYKVITEENLKHAVRELCARDRDLARVVDEHGMPSLWSREAGFTGLVRIILGQQVSLASAQAMFERLLTIASPLAPARLLELDDAEMKAVGFSRQKILYARELARAIVEGRLDLSALEAMPDNEVCAELTKIKGVGRWTADIYLLMCMQRADAWPAGDLALVIAAHRVKHLPARPTQQELDALAEAWRPLRSVAARILWQFYLCVPKARR